MDRRVASRNGMPGNGTLGWALPATSPLSNVKWPPYREARALCCSIDMVSSDSRLRDPDGNFRRYRREGKDESWWGYTWSVGPAQGEGRVNGREWQVRARGNA